MTLDVAVIGAGFAGVATARVLLRLEHRVTVFEAMPDVGGVWSKVRSYPHLITQNPSSTYHLSEMHWPKGAADFPKGPEVQAYIDSYTRRFGILEHVRLSTKVVSAVHNAATGRWELTIVRCLPTGEPDPGSPLITETFDQLVVCNGTFSEPHIPDFSGRGAFESAGGRIVHSSRVNSLEMAVGKHVVVVGYGKSACDLAVAASGVAARTTVVVRRLAWKLPRVFMNMVPYQHVLLTRLGELLFQCQKDAKPPLATRILVRPLQLMRRAAIDTIGWVAQWQSGLAELGLLPKGAFETMACTEVSIVSEGFFEGVRRGKVAVKRETSIASLGTNVDGQPCATLSDGTELQAELVVAGTGWSQRVPFLDKETMSKITDERGVFCLYRSLQAVDVPNLYFNGYNSSLFCPTSAEVAASWIGASMEGAIALPPTAERRRRTRKAVAALDQRGGKHALVPYSLDAIDTVLSDLGVTVPWTSYFTQWLLPIRPSAYKPVVDSVISRILTARA